MYNLEGIPEYISRLMSANKNQWRKLQQKAKICFEQRYYLASSSLYDIRATISSKSSPPVTLIQWKQ